MGGQRRGLVARPAKIFSPGSVPKLIFGKGVGKYVQHMQGNRQMPGFGQSNRMG